MATEAHEPSCSPPPTARVLFTVLGALLCVAGWGKLEINLGTWLHVSLGGSASGVFRLLLLTYLATRIAARDIDLRRTGWLREPFVWLCLVAIASPLWNDPDPAWPVRRHDTAQIFSLILPALIVYSSTRYLLDQGFHVFSLPLLRILDVALTLVSAQVLVSAPTVLTDLHQVDSSYEHHTHIAMRMVMAMPITLGLLFSDRRRAEEEGQAASGPGRQALYLLLLALQAIGLMIAHSRIGFIAFAVVMAHGALNATSARLRRAMVVASLGLALAALAVPQVRASVSSLLHLRTEENYQRRVVIYQTNLALMARHPWLGLGFSSRTFLYAGRALEGETFEYEHPHNLYMQIPVYLGLPGTACLVALLISIGAATRRLRERVADDQAPLLLGLRGALVGLAVMNLAETVLSSERLTFMVPVLIAFVMSWSRLVSATPQASTGDQTSSPTARMRATALLCSTTPARSV